MPFLKYFLIDVLKIDRSFIRDIGTNANDTSITSAIIAMARSLGLDTIAEGVEADPQLAFLQQEGCRIVQGYIFSKRYRLRNSRCCCVSSQPGGPSWASG